MNCIMLRSRHRMHAYVSLTSLRTIYPTIHILRNLLFVKFAPHSSRAGGGGFSVNYIRNINQPWSSHIFAVLCCRILFSLYYTLLTIPAATVLMPPVMLLLMRRFSNTSCIPKPFVRHHFHLAHAIVGADHSSIVYGKNRISITSIQTHKLAQTYGQMKKEARSMLRFRNRSNARDGKSKVNMLSKVYVGVCIDLLYTIHMHPPHMYTIVGTRTALHNYSTH